MGWKRSISRVHRGLLHDQCACAVCIPSTSSCCSSEEESAILSVPPSDNGEAAVTVERCHTFQVNQGGGAGHNHLGRVSGAHVRLCSTNQTYTEHTPFIYLTHIRKYTCMHTHMHVHLTKVIDTHMHTCMLLTQPYRYNKTHTKAHQSQLTFLQEIGNCPQRRLIKPKPLGLFYSGMGATGRHDTIGLSQVPRCALPFSQ